MTSATSVGRVNSVKWLLAMGAWARSVTLSEASPLIVRQKSGLMARRQLRSVSDSAQKRVLGSQCSTLHERRA